MKSAHRHELETNVLAHRLEVYIERYRPYASRIVGVIIAVVVLIFHLVVYFRLLGGQAERGLGFV